MGSTRRMLAITAALCASLVGMGGSAVPALAQGAPEEARIDVQAQTESAYDFFRAQGSDVAAGLLNGTVGPRVMKDGTYLHSYTQLGSATDATSLANMLASLDMLEEMNKVRTQVEHIGELKVTDTAMAYTMLAANWSRYTYDQTGSLQHSNPSAQADTLRWGTARAEVLSRGHRSARSAIGGWYWSEKAYVLGSSQTDLYGTTYSPTQNRQRGHYDIVRNGTYAIAGAAIAGTGNVRSVNLADVNRLLDAGSHTGTVSGEKTYTVAQYRARLQSYIDQVGGVDEPDEPNTPTTPDDPGTPDTPAAQPKIYITSQGEGLILYSDGGPGDIIYLTVAKADGWELESITATSEGKDVPLYLDPITKDYMMAMPDANVTVHAVFRQAGAEEPAESPSIRVEVEGSEGGYVTMPASAEPNTTVTGTILPKDGWWLYSATAEAGGRDLPFSLDVDEGVWKFAMPDEDVTIKVVFMPDTDEPDEPEPDEPAEIPGADTSEDDEDGTDTGFSDVKADDWFADAVAWAVEANAMKGYGGSDKFGPNDKLTRAMMAQTLWGLAGKPAVSLGDGLPSDVDAAEWYASSAAWSFQTGIFSGYGDNMFGPNDFITREQAATVLWRRAGKPASSQNLNIFPDADMTSSYAVDAMRWAVENGVFTGSEQNGQKLLDPTGICTRAQLATILMRMDEAGEL